MNLLSKAYIEVDHFQVCKYGQSAAGDIFYSQKNSPDGRIITTLSDGLGSGIKAGVLATLTSTMATKFLAQNIPMKRTAEIIMNTLPVSKELGISYATFTSVDIAPDSDIKIIEYDNPQYILLRGTDVIAPERQTIPFERANKETGPLIPTLLYFSKWKAAAGDRILFFSDGVTQSGLARAEFPNGWGRENVLSFVLKKIKAEPKLSARELSRAVVFAAEANDGYRAQDDISCGVIYFREPRQILVLTGPPWKDENDKEFAKILRQFTGKKIIAGGTTAKIIERELGIPIKNTGHRFDSDGPPESEMEGIDLVCEGIITLAAAAKILEQGDAYKTTSKAADKMAELLLESDIIDFVVGTKINDANYDPAIPIELEVRRTIIKRIASILETKHLKEVRLRFY
jgi:hypothetical protein